MGHATFISIAPSASRDNQLELMLPTLAGVIDWSLQPNGELTIEYAESEVGPKHIENAIEGLGYRIKHVDPPQAR